MKLEHLLGEGLVGVDELVQALDRQRDARPLLGGLAVAQRRLTPRAVDTILKWQGGREPHSLFGEIAVELGYLSEPEVRELLQAQHRETKGIEEILLEMGVLERLREDGPLRRRAQL